MSVKLPSDIIYEIYEIYRCCDFREQLILSFMLYPNYDKFCITQIPDIYSDILDDEILEKFPHLTSYSVGNFMKVSDKGIKILTKLEKLSCRGICKITDASICHLANLKFLDCVGNKNITQKSLINLRNLEILVVRQNFKLSSDTIRSLKKLREIWIYRYDDRLRVKFDTTNTAIVIKKNFVVDTYQKLLKYNNITKIIAADMNDIILNCKTNTSYYILYQDKIISADEAPYIVGGNYSYFPVLYDIEKIKDDIKKIIPLRQLTVL